MPFVKKGVVIGVGAVGDADDIGVTNSLVIDLNNKFYCYYTGYDGAKYRICMAVSKDGVHFTKKGVVIPLGAAGDIDGNLVLDPGIIKVNNKIYCYYRGIAVAGPHRCCLAISKDGVHFTKKGVVIPLGAAGEFDNTVGFGPHVIHHNNKFYCYYGGNDGAKYRVGLAISKDGVHFTKKGVVLGLGAVGDIDDNNIPGIGAVFIKNNEFYIYYTADDGAVQRSAWATSKDGIHFTKKGVVIPIGGALETDLNNAFYPGVIVKNNKFYSYYSGTLVATPRELLAISKVGA